MDLIVLAVTGAAILTGLFGVLVPRLPGVSLIWAAVLVWTSLENTRATWIVLGIATLLALANHTVQHLFAGRRIDELVAPMRSVTIAAILGVIGFLLARTLGMLAGFAVGIYLAERRRLRVPGQDRRANAHRPLVSREFITELTAGLLITAAWLVAVAG